MAFNFSLKVKNLLYLFELIIYKNNISQTEELAIHKLTLLNQ